MIGTPRAWSGDEGSDEMSAAERVVLDYTNHRGERFERTIIPFGLRFGTIEWLLDPQWLLDAYD